MGSSRCVCVAERKKKKALIGESSDDDQSGFVMES